LSLSFHSIAFTGNRLERLSEIRRDDCVDLARQGRHYRIILLTGGNPVMVANRLFLTHDEAEQLTPSWTEAVLLGHQAEYAILAAETDCNIANPYQHVDIRTLYSSGEIERDQLGILAQALSLLTWHKNNRFCARCGAGTKMCGGGVRRLCPACGTEHFPRTDPVGIMLVQHGERCLLARNVNFPEGRFSCLAGFIEQGETFEAAVRREVWEETGIKTGEVRYVASQPWPFPHSLMLGAFVQALSETFTLDRHEIAQAHWFERDEIAAMMAGHHPQGFSLPPSGSIGNFLIHSFWQGNGCF